MLCRDLLRGAWEATGYVIAPGHDRGVPALPSTAENRPSHGRLEVTESDDGRHRFSRRCGHPTRHEVDAARDGYVTFVSLLT